VLQPVKDPEQSNLLWTVFETILPLSLIIGTKGKNNLNFIDLIRGKIFIIWCDHVKEGFMTINLCVNETIP